MERLADAQQRALEQQKARQAGLQPEIEMPQGARGRPEGAAKETGPAHQANRRESPAS